QIRIHLRHLLSHEAELWCLIWIKLVLVAEGHRLQRQDRLARLVHRLDRLLETRRGSSRAQVTGVIDDNPYTSCHSDSVNASDIGVLVSWFRADANLGRLACNTSIADIDIVVARSKGSTSTNSQPNVIAAPAIAIERIHPGGRVAAAADVA